MPTQLIDPAAAAHELVSGWTTPQVLAYLTGNWRARHVPDPGPYEYISRCLIIDKNAGSSLIPFELWHEQQRALEFLIANPYVVSVKGRQVGITWLVLALMAYEADFGPNRLFAIGRQSEDYAKDAIVRLMYLRGLHPSSGEVLPESTMAQEWRTPIVAHNTTQIVLANGSSFQALTSTQKIGRGLVSHRGLADEFAFWADQEGQRGAFEKACANFDIISTGNGEGDDFHATWQIAVEGRGKYRPLFISANADPRRDEDWFRINVEEDANPDGAAREYARHPEDAFRAPEGAYFKRFSRAENVREFDVVPGWRTDVAVDWGLNHPAALLIQVSPSGQPFVFDEYLPTDEPKTTEFGHGIRAKLAAHKVAHGAHGPYADPAGTARNTQTKRSEFQVFRELGFSPVGVSSKVNDGCVYMRESIADEPDARLIVHPRCLGLISALTNVKPHRNDPNVYDTDHEIYSHPLDALRYWHVNRYQRRKKAGAGSVGGVPQGRDRSGF